MARKSPLKFETAFSRLEEKRLIGNGGAGRVYECTDEEGSIWAVKVLDPHRATSEKLKRFKNEYSFCAKHPHANIVGVTDAGVVELGGVKVPFFVMPYFPESLRTLLEKGKLSPADALKLFGWILDGVEAAHLWKVVHRDLKPENILFNPGDSHLVVADWGIAQFEAEELYTLVETGPATRLANFLYAAPEQRARGRDVDHRADIYALGLILNELFTREVPQGTSYRTIGAVAADYAFLDDLVAKMIAQSPDERPPSVQAIKAELIGRGQAFVERQKLDALQGTVVPAREVSDPLIANPVTVVGASWEDGMLTLKLNQPVNDQWVWSLQHMGSYVGLTRQPPQAFSFRGNEARVRADPSDVQIIIDHFKSWLPRANQVYATRAKEAAQLAEETERAALRARIAAADEKARVNRSIKI